MLALRVRGYWVLGTGYWVLSAVPPLPGAQKKDARRHPDVHLVEGKNLLAMFRVTLIQQQQR